MATFVLVHGSFRGAWCWEGVATRLEAVGHTVLRPTLAGLGERAHLRDPMPTLETWIEDVARVIRLETTEPVVLVGHSFAGMIVGAVADRMPERLRHLVYLEAQILESGESPLMRAPRLIEAYRRKAIASGTPGWVPAPPPSALDIADADLAHSVAARLTPQPLSVYEDAVELAHPLGNGLPATYVACTDPPYPTLESARERARCMPSWDYIEIATGHDLMLTKPDAVAALLSKLA